MSQTKCAPPDERKNPPYGRARYSKLHTFTHPAKIIRSFWRTCRSNSHVPIVSLPLKRIIKVRLPPAHKRDQTSQEVRRYEQWPPALGLSHMDPFMGTGLLEQFQVAPEHDMTQRHRRGAVLEKRAMSKQPGNDPAMDFQHAVHDLCTASAQKRQRPKPQPNGRRRKRPNVNQASGNRRSARHDSSSVAARLCTRCSPSPRYAQSASNRGLARPVDKLDQLGWWRFAEQSRPHQSAGPMRGWMFQACPTGGGT
jgi:hypothetical protein